MRKLLSSVVVLLLITGSLLLFSCGDLPEEDSSSGATLSRVSISPSIATLEVGATQSFTALAVYSDSTSVSVKPTWSVSGGIGAVTVVGYTGLLTASVEGTGSVVATYSSKSDSATVTVTGTDEAADGVVAVLSTIEVSPATVNARVGSSTQIFTASGVDSSGESMTIEPAWSISGEAIGILTFSGTMATLEVTAEGTALINCISGEVIAFSFVTIEGYIVEITVETDTYVDDANPSDAFGTETSLRAGYVSATAKHSDAFFKFSLSSVPAGATIESATLKLYPTSAGSSSLQLKNLTSAFTDNATSETSPEIGSFILSGAFTAGGYNSLSNDDLKDLVQAWNDGTTTNHGLALVQEGTEDGTVVILSKENGDNPPMLRLEYTMP